MTFGRRTAGAERVKRLARHRALGANQPVAALARPDTAATGDDPARLACVEIRFVISAEMARDRVRGPVPFDCVARHDVI